MLILAGFRLSNCQVLSLPLPKQLIWDMYGPKLEMIRGYIWSICGAGMELIWATTPHIIPIHYIAIVQDYGKYRKLALIHMLAISFYVEMIWEVRFNTTWLAAMENVWDYQLFFLHSKPIPKER